MKFISPLKIMASIKKVFTLNLNQYRNTHYRVLNTCKINYKNYMEGQILMAGRFNKIACVYTVWKDSKRAFDLGNVCSVHQKFFEDALVELGKLEDDNVKFIPLVIYKEGGVDKENPRVDIDVIELNEEGKSYLHSIIDSI